jgi:2'-5' RNA ligase
MKKIRAFIAIPLPDQVQRLLGNITHAWSNQIPEQSVRWVKPQLMHITLRFLGVTDSRIIPSLIQVLDNVTAEHEFFTLRLDKPGCFPNIKRPRVIWVGLQGQLSAVQLLKKAVDEAVVPLGWEIENRSFRPHLTLGRVKESRKVRGHRWEAEIQPLSVPVRKIHLIESRLQQDGPIYTIRHESFLRDR